MNRHRKVIENWGETRLNCNILLIRISSEVENLSNSENPSEIRDLQKSNFSKAFNSSFILEEILINQDSVENIS